MYHNCYYISSKSDINPAWFVNMIDGSVEPRESLDGNLLLLEFVTAPEGLETMCHLETLITLIDSNWVDDSVLKSLPEVDGWEDRRDEILLDISKGKEVNKEEALGYIYYGK